MIVIALLALAVLALVAQDLFVSLRGGDGVAARVLKGERLLRRKRDRVRMRLVLLVQDKDSSNPEIQS